MGVHRACFFIARAGRAATPERNRSGNQPPILCILPLIAHQLASARSNFLIASPESALVVEAPGARRITIRAIEPGVHAVTNLDLDDENDARISLVRENLDPAHFVTSAQSLCRHERIIIAGAERGTVSSSLALVGSEILLYHVLGNPNQDVYRLYCLGR